MVYRSCNCAKKFNVKPSKKLLKCMKANNKSLKTKVNNQLFMDNQERYKNVAMGYMIQVERLWAVYGKGLENNLKENFELIKSSSVLTDRFNQAVALIKKIQQILVDLQSELDKYNKHLNNVVYCKTMMIPYVRKLNAIIAETDLLVKVGATIE